MNLVLIYKLEAHGGGSKVAAIITIRDLLDFHSLAISFRCFLSPVCTVSERGDASESKQAIVTTGLNEYFM